MAHPHDIDPQAYRPCQNYECAGTGWIRCKRCLGDGYIEQESWDYALNRPRWTRQVCPTCYGLGGWKCSVCKGSGSIVRERPLKASNAELISEVVHPEPRTPRASADEPSFDEPYLHNLSYDELHERFEAVRKVAVDTLDRQRYSPHVRELRRLRFEQLHLGDIGVMIGLTLLQTTGLQPLLMNAGEEEKLRKLGVHGDFKVTGDYPDDKLQSKREIFAMWEMVRIVNVAAARDMLTSYYSTLNGS